MGLGLLGLSADQLAKGAVLARLEPGVPVDVLGSFLRVTLVRNSGAAFSLGAGYTVVLAWFAAIALTACVVLGLPRVANRFHGLILGLLMAGIAGNLFDRIFREPSPMRGHVIDFIQLPNFAIFNVADMCIVAAAALVVISTFTHRDAEPAEA